MNYLFWWLYNQIHSTENLNYPLVELSFVFSFIRNVHLHIGLLVLLGAKNSKYDNNVFNEHLVCIKLAFSQPPYEMGTNLQCEKIKVEKVLQVSSCHSDCKLFKSNQGLFILIQEPALLTISAYVLLQCQLVCSFSLACLWISHSNHFPRDRIPNWLWSQLL